MSESTTRTVNTTDGHSFELICSIPESPRSALYWLPALGVSARAYRPFARVLADSGVAVYLHEWRGMGSSNRRAGRDSDWAYRELLETDIPEGMATARQELSEISWLIGGHSLGAQLAVLALGRDPHAAGGLVIVGGGAPYWRSFPLPMKLLLPGVFGVFRGTSALLGYFPGKRMGFGGNEARSLIRDWTRSGWTGQYQPAGLETDLEAAMARLQRPVLAVSLANDSYVPRRSLEWLTGKLPECTVRNELLKPVDFNEHGADHFGWMKEPEPVVEKIIEWAGWA